MLEVDTRIIHDDNFVWTGNVEWQPGGTKEITGGDQ